MGYSLDFSWIVQYAPLLLAGVVTTIWLSVLGTVGGFAVGLGAAWTLSWGPKPLRLPVRLYVELMRNTPFLIQLFFVFFGLPQLGIKLSATEAAVLASFLNIGAYTCDIIRAGIEATPRGQVEAASSLGMSRIQAFRHVVLFPALQRVRPALASQFVIVMLGTSVVSQISVNDLTFAATFAQSRNFRSFETYFVCLVGYLVLAILLRLAVDRLGRLIFGARRPS